ncbi:DUF6090 family protein [Eudoraea chungangensis]|uniref:DUF6090 family protein n=1 Tax=Eudoraea chungangensis TaxID=1481905 RepID=UPI0023EA9FB3|nr:DUF6090 family protein [Eudoraea chungangensis]
MIKFFRRLRQNLISEGKTEKYFKYAIGEIILVVIGILVALSINNWNDQRKNRLTEAEYYCKLLNDLELDQKNIEILYKESQYKIEVSKKLLLELKGTKKDKSYFIDNYIQALRTNIFVPTKATITDILSTGKLNLFTNDSLKNSIIDYYAELDKYLYQLEINHSKSLERGFAYESDLEFGFHYAKYAKIALGPEIVETLPVNDWQFDKDSDYFKQFQDDLVLFVMMSEREKQHFDGILNEMQPIYQQLKMECTSR